jgi:hypothetical protein
MPSSLQRESTFSILEDTHAPSKRSIHDMETEFGTGWLVKQIKKQMTQNCKRLCCNQTKKIKGIPLELRNKRRPIDVSVKVWKEIGKEYDRVGAERKSGEESTHVFEFLTLDYFKSKRF